MTKNQVIGDGLELAGYFSSLLEVPFKDLQQICQPGKTPRLSTVELWARRNGIAYKYDARGGIWTTLDAINAALGLTPITAEPDHYNPDELL